MDNLANALSYYPDRASSIELYRLIAPIWKRLRSASFGSAALAIKAEGSDTVKTGAAWYGMAAGKLQTIAASVDMPDLDGTVTAAMFNVFVFSIDSAGTTYATMGTEGDALATVILPTLNPDLCVVGYLIINPLGTGDFVGATTPLDDATVVPTAVYVNAIGTYDPLAKL